MYAHKKVESMNCPIQDIWIRNTSINLKQLLWVACVVVFFGFVFFYSWYANIRNVKCYVQISGRLFGVDDQLFFGPFHL